jgi:hypothetical protein
MRSRTITCPAGQTESFVPGSLVEFNPEACASCPLRAKCTSAAPGSGRTVAIAHDEQLQHRLLSPIASERSGMTSRRDHEQARWAPPRRTDQVSSRRSREAAYPADVANRRSAGAA